MYALIRNQTIEKYPYSIGDLRKDNPQVSFPKRPSDELLAEYGVLPVTSAPEPAYDVATQRVEWATPVLDGDTWKHAWSIVALTTEEAAALASAKANDVRIQRDALIAATDYLALSDTTLTPEMAAYRQALRDITSHANFPYLNEADWPVKPV